MPHYRIQLTMSTGGEMVFFLETNITMYCKDKNQGVSWNTREISIGKGYTIYYQIKGPPFDWS